MATIVTPKAKKITATKYVTISMANTKLGKIPSFSLPSITTCPGATSWCVKACYAQRLERQYKNVNKSYEMNLDTALNNKDFVLIMNTEISKLVNKGITTFRWHVSGDWVSCKYIYDWVNIVKSNPTMTFYGYTRSWCVPNLLPHLENLKKLSNVVLFASTDVTTTETVPLGWREAFAGDVMPNNKPKMITCLEQAGKLDSCDKCKLCFNNKSTVNIYFKTH